MLKHKASLVVLIALFPISMVLSSPRGNADPGVEIDISFQKFVLDNGLTLIVHEDHKAPIVAVNVWYHVGSKNEKPGKTGFAHLFEHLMFNGSENFDGEYFAPFEQVGATDMNGTTNRDRTNYFQNVPSPALDIALWMESDRMGHLLGAVTEDKVDEQRGVVQNEKRQGDNQPYGKTRYLMAENAYPAGHPYSWTTIGSMEDLNAAALEDVHEWFKTYYGAANAVIVVAGDVDTKEVKSKVEQYFGDIPSGPPVGQQDVWIAKRSGTHRQITQDRVPHARVYKIWNVPEWGSVDADYLDLVSDLLAAGKTSRLHKRLVHQEQIATDVSAYVWAGEIGGQFVIQATAREGESLEEVEKAVDEELERFLDSGPTARELKRVKTQNMSRFVRGIERIGGFGGKSDILAMNEVYAGDAAFYKVTVDRIRRASTRDLQSAAKRWLSDGVYILEVHPFPEYKTIATTVDRSKLPEAGNPPEPKFPTLHRTTLSNGLKIVLAERHAVPVVNFNLFVDAGFASDQFAVQGTARLAMDMLDEGTEKRTALEISEQLALLGAHLGTGSNLDMSSVFLSTLKENIDSALDIYADVILNPSFPKEDIERLRKQQLASIRREKASPFSIAIRLIPRLLYGSGHAYGNSFTGSGTEESVLKITREDLLKFHNTWFKPNNVTLIVVGDTTLAEITPELEKLFQGWTPGDVPRKNISRVEHRSDSVVYLMDRPGSPQSIVIAGHVAPPKANPEEIAIESMNTVLGGSFTSRVNMNLRETKHWAYGAGTFVFDARGQRPFVCFAPVQADKTKESMVEMAKELRDIRGPRPVTKDELTKVQNQQTLELPGSWETISEVGASISEIVRFGLPDDYYDTYPDKVRALTLSDVSTAAQNIIHPDNLIWIVIGDRAKIENVLQDGFGELLFIDADGTPVE